jgi:hypothetical protein
MNTAIAGAKDPVKMAEAMRAAAEAGVWPTRRVDPEEVVRVRLTTMKGMTIEIGNRPSGTGNSPRDWGLYLVTDRSRRVGSRRSPQRALEAASADPAWRRIATRSRFPLGERLLAEPMVPARR